MYWIVDRRRHELEMWDDAKEKLLARFSVGVGRPDAATPLGVWHVVKPTRPDDRDGIAQLSTDRLICIRTTEHLDSIGRSQSGG